MVCIRRWTAVAFALLAAATLPWPAAADRFDVSVTAGTRVTAAGDTVDYLLFVPHPAAEAARLSVPAVVLTHGFARDYGRHVDTAVFLAERGIAVMTPNMVSIAGLLLPQRRNIRNTADHARWLAARSADPQDPLYGVIDGTRIALAGHSAGGAISSEAALELQDDGPAAAALVLLDAVPYPRTVRSARSLSPLPILSLRAEPAACNAFDAVSDLVDAIPFAIEDLRVVGATHCDPEGPSDVTCALACGGRDPVRAETFRTVMYRFLAANLAIPATETEDAAYERAVRGLMQRGELDMPIAPGN
ncbi:MAG: alpha/beta hydrolase family protein [Rhodospirillales bacterium]